jgi:hypothetical protein
MRLCFYFAQGQKPAAQANDPGIKCAAQGSPSLALEFEAKPGQILISPRVLTKVENAVKVEPVGEFELKGIRRPFAAYNVIAAIA